MAKEEVEYLKMRLILLNGDIIEIRYPDECNGFWEEMELAIGKGGLWYAANLDAVATYREAYLEHINMNQVVGLAT